MPNKLDKINQAIEDTLPLWEELTKCKRFVCAFLQKDLPDETLRELQILLQNQIESLKAYKKIIDRRRPPTEGGRQSLDQKKLLSKPTTLQQKPISPLLTHFVTLLADYADDTLDSLLEFIETELSPEEIFSDQSLGQWAKDAGYVYMEDNI